MTDTILEMKNISKYFPGVKALDGVSLKVRRGTVHALMGENGAGKSTLMKCLFGIYSKDSGDIFLEGKEINFKNNKTLEKISQLLNVEIGKNSKKPKDTNENKTKKLDDSIFTNLDETRMLVRKNDSSVITDEILDEARIDKVASIEKYDYILFDRYVQSNMLHQAGKIENKDELVNYITEYLSC